MIRNEAIALSKDLKKATGGKRLCAASKSDKYGWGVWVTEPDGSSTYYYAATDVHAAIRKLKEDESACE